MAKSSKNNIPIGVIAQRQREQGEAATPLEITSQFFKDRPGKTSFEEQLWESAKRGIADPEIKTDFFLVSLLLKEPTLPNFLHQYFFYRKTCPNPNFDQTVYQYHWEDKRISFLWVIPDEPTCKAIKRGKIPLGSIPDLTENVKRFYNGELQRLSDSFSKT